MSLSEIEGLPSRRTMRTHGSVCQSPESKKASGTDHRAVAPTPSPRGEVTTSRLRGVTISSRKSPARIGSPAGVRASSLEGERRDPMTGASSSTAATGDIEGKPENPAPRFSPHSRGSLLHGRGADLVFVPSDRLAKVRGPVKWEERGSTPVDAVALSLMRATSSDSSFLQLVARPGHDASCVSFRLSGGGARLDSPGAWRAIYLGHVIVSRSPFCSAPVAWWRLAETGSYPFAC